MPQYCKFSFQYLQAPYQKLHLHHTFYFHYLLILRVKGISISNVIWKCHDFRMIPLMCGSREGAGVQTPPPEKLQKYRVS